MKFKVKPTQKENWRYIAFEVLSEANFSEKDITRALISSVIKLLGEVGASKTNIWLLEYSGNSKTGIIRCSHKAVNSVVASMTGLAKIDDKKAAFLVLGVSGTIKKLKEKYFK